MKANELRLNNLVERLVKNPQKKDPLYYYKISKIDQQDFYYYDENIFRPILLSENWLLKFGFEFDEEEKIYQKKDIKIEVIDGDLIFNYFHSLIYLKSLHQLQNLYFALTNEELIIKQ